MGTDWWMYHRDEMHSGVEPGPSNIYASTAASLAALPPVTLNPADLNEIVLSIPCVVGGSIYVGTVNTTSGRHGALYRIDLASGSVTRLYEVSDTVGIEFGAGIGGSPAVVAGKVYFTSFGGMVYRVDAVTGVLEWSTNLNTPSAAQNQPVSNPAANTWWSSPLLVNGCVYVATGNSDDTPESANAFGFIWCLHADTGQVKWLFCTNQFSGGDGHGQTNRPNVIPRSCAPGGLPGWATMFSLNDDPPHRGCTPWSSPAYDSTHNKIFIGTGNSSISNRPCPDAWYGTGVLALNADTGVFGGYNAPQGYDSYYPTDTDVDICASPVVFTRGGRRVIGIGSKNGSFFIYDCATMGQLNSRQLLPKDALTGAHLSNVDPGGASGGENMYGIFGNATVDATLGRIFVGLGGPSNDTRGVMAIDTPTTPFLRALNWNDLSDAWPVSVVPVGSHHVSKYSVGAPPLYTNSGESGLSSPAIVNDVVLISTTWPALYAFNKSTGAFLWRATNLPAAPTPGTSPVYTLGPAVSGNYIVLGCGPRIYRYQAA